ncbi:MAG: addiction module toxin RelE [bacterium]|nr:addiction module toxin RelE [bacterium]
MFHVVARGVERRTLFIDEADRRCFLKILGTACERYKVLVHAYCLMNNHYHLLLQSLDGRLSSAMRHLNGSYGRWFNRRRDRVGHLFQGRFKASLIEAETYLLEVVRYIELNPCRAGLVDDPVAWPASSYRARVGLDEAPVWLDRKEVLQRFGAGTDAIIEYREFVNRGLSRGASVNPVRTNSIVGSPAFVSRHAERARHLASSQKVPRRQRLADRPSIGELLATSTSESEMRRRAVRAVVDYGYTMTAVAHHLNRHYTTISRWVAQCRSDNS